MQDGSAASQWLARILITANTGRRIAAGNTHRADVRAPGGTGAPGAGLRDLDRPRRQHYPPPRALGVFFVLSLWTVAVFGLIAHIGYVLPPRLIIWGIVIGWFGISQQHLFPGTYHWIVQVLHLAVGMIAIGLAEVVSARVKKGGAPKMAP